MSNLDDVYAGRTINEETQEVQHAHQPTEEIEATGETGSTPEPETEKEEAVVDWRAKAEESDKARQEAERRAKGLEQAIAATRQKVREQPAYSENPEAYIQQVRDEFSQQLHTVRIESFQSAARSRHADYEQKEAVFAELAEQNPYLVAQLQRAHDPAEFAYKTAEFHLAQKASGGSLDALRAQITAELQAQQNDKFQSKAQGLPKTLAGASGTGRTSGQTYTGPTPLNDIYKRK